MANHNTEIARIFEEVANLLEIDGANPFRVRAYRDAARTINALSQSVADMVDGDKGLTALSDIGHSIAEKIEEIVNTGSLKQLKELKQQVPPESTDLLDIAGLGPKRIRKLRESLDITDMDDLEQAAQQKKIREVEGFGKKLEAQILHERNL